MITVILDTIKTFRENERLSFLNLKYIFIISVNKLLRYYWTKINHLSLSASLSLEREIEKVAEKVPFVTVIVVLKYS